MVIDDTSKVLGVSPVMRDASELIHEAAVGQPRLDEPKIPAAIALSKATLRNIKQNLFWAYAYNTILIPVAMGILYPFLGLLLNPVLAAAAMAASSVTVVSNALRLRRFQPPQATPVGGGHGI